MALNIVRFLHITVIFVILCQTQGVPQVRIIDGYLAEKNQFPWHVLLNSTRTNNSVKYCGGSLIAPNFVLTAASCIENALTIKVDAGIISFNSPTERQNSSLYLIHPYYNSTTGLNDIAIIKLDKSFTYRENIRSIVLPGKSQANNSFVYQQCYFSGFGMNDRSEDVMSRDLYWSSNVVVSNNYCEQSMEKERIGLCAVSYESSVCFGDQGGALIFYVTGKFYQIGLLTIINPNGCYSGNPHIYTKITDHLDWIAYYTGLTFDY